MRRKLVYCGRRASGLEVFLGSGWELIENFEPAEIQTFAIDESADVGIVRIESTNKQYLSKIEECILRSGCTQWVALVDEATLQSEEVASLISNHFCDYHTMPLDKGRFLNCIGHASGMANLMRKIEYQAERATGEYEKIIGTSAVMQRLFRQINKVVKCDSAVLLRGESGTGKELVAQEIHKKSSRSHGPMIAVNCGSLPEKLVQSELFGHEKGAFTGATTRKVGKVEAASGGTIFLDEIGDLPYEAQVNLLRFLQEGTIERVGGTETIQVDVRVIAATHVDLEAAIKEGRFREDLYYRLNVLNLEIPPLRDRGDDIEILAQSYLEKFALHHNSEVRGFCKQAIAGLRSYDWPGNVRELVNRIQRAVIMAEGKLITSADLGLDGGRESIHGKKQTLDTARGDAERSVIKDALYMCNNNITEASKILGVSRVTLYRLLDKHKLPTAHSV